jgi:site-specific DNA recombinase
MQNWAVHTNQPANPFMTAGASARQLGKLSEKPQRGEWLPRELKARLQSVGKALAHTESQKSRLLEAYLGGVLELAEFARKRKEIEGRTGALLAHERQLLDASARERTELAGMAESIERFCENVREGLADATFVHKRRLVELLIDRVTVSDEEVQIRYVVPTSLDGPHQPFASRLQTA